MRTTRTRTVAASLLVVAVSIVLSACTPEHAIVELFPEQVGKATAVAECESNLNPDATGRAGERGIFQIHPVHREAFESTTGRPWSDAYDPWWNTVFARVLYDQQGWGPWTCRHAG